MHNKIILNIVEPDSPTPLDPVTPNTGLFTHGIGGPEATIITVSIVAIIVIVAVVLYYKKKHNKDNIVNKENKANKATKLSDAINTIKSKKKVSISLAVLAMVVSLGTLATLLVNAGKSNTNAADSNESLTLDVSSEDLTVKVADEPVFAVLPVELTVEEATQTGYTLTAFSEDTSLVSTTDNTNIIPMVAADEGELVALVENTYGLALDNKPTSKDDEVYIALSTDADNPTFITDKDYEGTGENDKTTIYYGFYITPDTPKGIYESSEITYSAEANRTDLATVTFDGNGLTFDNVKTNDIRYIPNVSMGNEAYSHTPNVNDEGVQDGVYPIDLNKTFVYRFADATEVKLHLVKMEADGTCGPNYDQYFSFWQGNHPDYTAVNNWESGEKVSGSNGKYIFASGSQYAGMDATVQGDTLTFAYTTSDHRGSWCADSGYGYYAVITGIDADGNSTELLSNELYAGNYMVPTTDGAIRFLGWSTNKDATVPMYTDEDSIARSLSLAVGEKVTLYAVYESTFTISYNGNSADSITNMDNVSQYSTVLEPTDKQVDLLASNFTKEGYGFVGWSADEDAWEHLTDDDDSNNPTIYGPNQMITIDEKLIEEAGENRKLILNAVWAPAETDSNGNPIALQDWQGCSTLTPTTYNTETGALTVGKNTITALTDNRDGSIYTVARLADGNCWMTENLRLDDRAVLSQQNTNNPSLPLTNDYAEGTTSNSISATSDIWCRNYSMECYDQSKLNTNNTIHTTASPSFAQNFTDEVHKNFDDKIISYGNYYNWYSATAGNGTYDTITGNVSGDICPAGWVLPVGGQTDINGSFSHLDVVLGGTGKAQSSTEASNKWRSFPNNFVYSGRWNGSSAIDRTDRGSSGYYWSSTANSHSAYYFFLIKSSENSATTSGNEFFGHSVRCVAPVL